MLIKTSVEGKKNFEKPHIDEGLYTAKLKEVKNIENGQFGKRVVFIYSIVVNNTEVDLPHICYVPEVATPDNKFGKVLIAHGVELGKDVEVDSLIGTQASVLVEDYEYEEDGTKKLASSISKVKSLKKA